MEEELKGKITSLNICCFGVNHIGVTVAAVFAEKCPFFNITVVDLDPEKITSWNTKQIKMHEEGLEKILRKSQNKNLMFINDFRRGIKLADVIFLCLCTKTNQKGFALDLTETEKATRLIAEFSENSKIIVLKSTVPPGTCENIQRILFTNRKNKVRFQVLSVPVFLSAGNAISALMNPERVLIGSDFSRESLRAAEVLVCIYSYWVPKNRIITMKNWSAEISRLSHNAFLAQRLSSLSSLCVLCEETGGDISEVIRVLKEFSDVGGQYLKPSFGWGGPFLKNDLNYLIYMCNHMNLKEPAEYWKEVLRLNEYHKTRFIRKISSTYYNTLKNEKITVWGIAFKKNSEVLEGSTGIEMCLFLLKEGAKLSVFDTMEKRQVMEEFKAAAKKTKIDTSLLREISYCEDPYKAAHKSNAIIVCNEMDEFKNIDFNLIYRNMIKPPNIFDGQKCLPHEELIKLGFNVRTIGIRFGQYTQ